MPGLTRGGSRGEPGALAIVLHTHMPYVEGFGTWPFGEEWLWEAIATSYLPLLRTLDRVADDSGRAPVTLSLTPVLGDQLEAPGALERCLGFLRHARRRTHASDIGYYRAAGEAAAAAELERSAAEYAAAADELERHQAQPGGLVGAFAARAGWTSAATHAVLPLLASDSAIRLQVQTGIAAHRRRSQSWGGGFWLPECAYGLWLDEPLAAAGVGMACVEIAGLRAPAVRPSGLVLVPIDREVIALVWSHHGYPAHPAYRNYHGFTPHHHRVWRNDGQFYDRNQARAQAARDARDFVERVRARVRSGGLCVCALDTELLGHWWYEGIAWLEHVIAEAGRQGLRLSTVDAALEHHEPVPAPDDLPVSSWGEGGDLRTWSAPKVADLAWAARTAELRLLRAGDGVAARALRELLALQSSDWAFLDYRELAAGYPRERVAGHTQGLERALEAPSGVQPEVGNLAPDLTGWEA